MLFWRFFPPLAINEILLGQRIPSLSLLRKGMDRKRGYEVPCPHCGAVHSGDLWARSRAFGNWFGLYCPCCGGTIPCLWNITSLAFLGLTSPLWYFFRRPLYRGWLKWQQKRFSTGNTPEPEPQYLFWKLGLFFWLAMFLLVEIILPLMKGEFGKNPWGVSLLIWCAGGVFFALSMKWYLSRKAK